MSLPLPLGASLVLIVLTAVVLLEVYRSWLERNGL